MAVLDSQLRVRGIAGLRVRGITGLRVVDAGAMPSIPSGNTNSPTLLVAEKVAEWIRQGQDATSVTRCAAHRTGTRQHPGETPNAPSRHAR